MCPVRLQTEIVESLQRTEFYGNFAANNQQCKHCWGYPLPTYLASPTPALEIAYILSLQEPTPAPYVKEMADAGMFYVNRVLKEYKEK